MTETTLETTATDTVATIAEETNSATEAPAAELVIDLSSPVATLEKEAPECDEVLPQHSKEYYDEYIESFVPSKKKKLFFRFVKRTFDIFASFVALLLLSPVMLICAIAIKCDSKGPAVFCQQRVGRNGEPFKFYKFRSMYITAPKECATSLLIHPEQHITKVGGFLRKTSLDELPQLWCVLVGTMSFIGYRPLVLTEEKCNEMRCRLDVFSMRPGISGYAQVHGRDDVHYKDKAILDAEYVKNASVWLDIKIFLQTALIVFRADGNDQKKIDERENENAQ
jgi:O-antigen biosynthesis protein WbqP